MVKPSLEEAGQIAKTGLYNVIPVATEMFSDLVTPIDVLKKLMAVSKHCFILESAEDTKNWGRYTFLGYDPKIEITCLNGEMKITSADEVKSFQTDDPNKHILEILEKHKGAKIEGFPPFTGGLVGYFAYDYAKYAEPSLKLDAPDKEYFQDVDLMLFDKVIAFDHYKQKIVLIVNINAENIKAEYKSGVEKLDDLKSMIKNGVPQQPARANVKSELKTLFTKNEFCEMVNKAKGHIKEGDIFQVVLSNRFEADFEGSLFDTYRVMRTINPSPYMFYFSGSDLEIAGASPETLVKLQDGKLFTYPLAGTRPRGADDIEDLALEKDCLRTRKSLPNTICW